MHEHVGVFVLFKQIFHVGKWQGVVAGHVAQLTVRSILSTCIETSGIAPACHSFLQNFFSKTPGNKTVKHLLWNILISKNDVSRELSRVTFN